MRNELRLTSRAGFTLIEVLVTLILVSLLAAAVFPVVTQQIGAADAPRLGNDLSSIRAGIEQFNANLRKSFPGDLEDLVYQPSDAGDLTLAGVTYSNDVERNRWDGPYLDVAIAEAAQTPSSTVATTSGFSSTISSELVCYDPTGDAVVTPGNCAKGHFVAVQIADLSVADFDKINDLFDGDTETNANYLTEGKVRCDSDLATPPACTVTYYLAVPFRK